MDCGDGVEVLVSGSRLEEHFLSLWFLALRARKPRARVSWPLAVFPEGGDDVVCLAHGNGPLVNPKRVPGPTALLRGSCSVLKGLVTMFCRKGDDAILRALEHAVSIVGQNTLLGFAASALGPLPRIPGSSQGSCFWSTMWLRPSKLEWPFAGWACHSDPSLAGP